MTVAVAVIVLMVLTGSAILAVWLNSWRRVENRPVADSAVLGPRSWHSAAAGRFAHLVKDGRPVTVLAINVDRLTLLNRRCGRGAGDAVLDSVGTILLARAGAAGLVGHLSGDHFVVLLAADADGARQIAEVISHEVRALSGHLPGDGQPPIGRLTVSIGAAVHPRDGRAFDELELTADVLLFAAKNGRDQVSLSRPTPAKWATRRLAG